jgi:hypothetical protein
VGFEEAQWALPEPKAVVAGAAHEPSSEEHSSALQ